MTLQERLRCVFTLNSPWPWLAYLALYFPPWFFRPPTEQELWVTALAMPTFLGLYIAAFKYRERFGLVFAFAIAALGLVTALVMPTACVFLVFAGATIGWTRPRRRAAFALVALLIVIAIFSYVIRADMYFWAPAIFFTAMTSFASMMSATMHSNNLALHQANIEIEKLATQAERERIARDLHDLLGHTLTVISVKAELAAKLTRSDPARAESEIADIQVTARRALQEVRFAVDDMKRASLSAEIARARTALDAIDVTLKTDAHLPDIPAAFEQPIALIIREAITNVVRHARASTCHIAFEQSKDRLRIIIADNGIGGVDANGNGVSGMRARVEALGGALHLRADGGATIEVSLPVSASPTNPQPEKGARAATGAAPEPGAALQDAPA